MTREHAKRIASRLGPAPSFLVICASPFMLRDDIAGLALQGPWIMVASVANAVATALLLLVLILEK
jgi:hypothetical protein